MMRAFAVGCAVVALLLFSARANALTPYAANDYANDMWIGCVNHAGTGERAWLCYDNTWVQLSTNCSITEDLIISGEGGNDNITAINGTGVLLSDECAGTWQGVGFGSYYVYLAGQSGADHIYGRSGNNDCRMAGDGGDDVLYSYSTNSNSFAAGGTGNDIVIGISASCSADSLFGDNYGGSGDDCVEDRGSGWEDFDCGDGADHYDSNGQGNPGGSCGSSVASCL